MQIELVNSNDGLQQLAERWNKLAGDHPFRRYTWLSTWWRHYGSDRELFVVVVKDEAGQVLGIAPWCLRRSLTEGRVLEELGSGGVCTDYLTVLTPAEQRSQVVDELARWLSRQQGWDLLRWDAVNLQDPAIGQLCERLQEMGHRMDQRPGPNCWRIELPDTWDGYLARLSKSHRKQVRRFQRRILDSGEAVLHTASTDEQWQRGMAILEDLHQRRRNSLGEPGLFACDAYAGFVHDVGASLLSEGRLHLHWLTLGDRPVAAEFHLLGDKVTYAYQAGVDPDVLEEEPGRLITIATLVQAIENGYQGYDFLRGDEPYKAHWRAQPEETVRLRIVARRAVSQLRHRVWLAGRTMKGWLNSSPSDDAQSEGRPKQPSCELSGHAPSA